jgi:hypothetical protein
VGTNELIDCLAGSAGPVRRLPAPRTRVAVWLAIALPYVAVVMLMSPMEVDLAEMLADKRFLIEQGAAFLTAVAAALAAFCSVVPGYDRRILLLPLVPLALWLVSLGEGCVRDWVEFGADGLQVRPDWGCLPAASVIGILPAIAMVVMLRRGAPLYPRVSVALGALAVAALGAFGMRLFHIGDATVMVLFWHFGTVALLSALAGWAGRSVLAWRHVVAFR